VLAETERDLSLKAPRALPTYHRFRNLLAATVVNPSARLVRRVATLIEPEDAPIVAGAMKAKATYLASYDRKHLPGQRPLIQNHFQIKVATPAELLR
jgi:predicted nucleic acid-binding protein